MNRFRPILAIVTSLLAQSAALAADESLARVACRAPQVAKWTLSEEVTLHERRTNAAPPPFEALVEALSSEHRERALLDLGVPACRIGSDFFEELWFDLRDVSFARLEPRAVGRLHLENLVLDLSHWSGLDLRGKSFAQSVLRGATFEGCLLDDASFEGAALDHATFRNSSLRGAKLNGASVGPVTVFERCDLTGANFTAVTTRPYTTVDHAFSVALIKSQIDDATFGGASLPAMTFRDLWIRDLHLENADIRRSRFDGVRVENIDASEARLDGVRFSGTKVTGTVSLRNTTLGHAEVGDLLVGNPDIRRVDWGADFVLGEEDRADEATEPNFKTRLLRAAEVTYRQLTQRYRELGFGAEARRFEYRAMEVRRRLLQARLLSHPRLSLEASEWLWLTISAAVGHGCLPSRWLLAFSGAIVIFALVRMRTEKVTMRRALLRAFYGLILPAGRVLDLRPLVRVLGKGEKEQANTSRVLGVIELACGLVFLTFAVRTIVNLHS
jgi:uncharacterized protein YjbI with pentapeptide repeats